MKNLFLIFSILLIPAFSFAQKPVFEMNDCEFFDYIEILKSDNYTNPDYHKVRENFELRSNLLKKLESYLIVLHNFDIAPMYLQNYPKDHRACSTYSNEYDSLISEGLKPQKARDSVQNEESEDIRFLLIDLSNLNRHNNNNVKMYLSEFEHPFTLEYLYYDVKESYYSTNQKDTLHKLPEIIKEQNLQILAKRLDFQDNKRYGYYENYNSEPDFSKGFEMYHENDVFILYPGMNQDRELTGGFKFTIVTDYLKWRWLRIGNKKEDNVLTYQTLSLLGSGYTPYIRYRNNYELADTLHSYDRPFSSFLCLERAKHRMWRNGLIRHKGEFQVGTIGISQGRKIQAKLHEDVITRSQFVHGWDKQIANGGRLVIQSNHELDMLLWSNTNRYKTVFRPYHYLVDDPDKYAGVNIIGEIDAKVGTIMTAFGAGLRFSTLDFLKQSGNQMILSKNNAKDDFGWKFDFGLSYRYVVHNSLLEGLGLFNTFEEDPYDIVLSDHYILEGNEIERNMFMFDWGLNLKWRKTTVFLRQNFHTLEYRSGLSNIDFNNANFTSLLTPEDITFYNDKVVKEQNDFLNREFLGRQIYGYGTLGLSWIIE